MLIIKLLQNFFKRHLTGGAKDENILNACKTDNIPLRNPEKKHCGGQTHWRKAVFLHSNKSNMHQQGSLSINMEGHESRPNT